MLPSGMQNETTQTVTQENQPGARVRRDSRDSTKGCLPTTTKGRKAKKTILIRAVALQLEALPRDGPPASQDVALRKKPKFHIDSGSNRCQIHKVLPRGGIQRPTAHDTTARKDAEKRCCEKLENIKKLLRHTQKHKGFQKHAKLRHDQGMVSRRCLLKAAQQADDNKEQSITAKGW
jgi:hypothetical protein